MRRHSSVNLGHSPPMQPLFSPSSGHIASLSTGTYLGFLCQEEKHPRRHASTTSRCTICGHAMLMIRSTSEALSLVGTARRRVQHSSTPIHFFRCPINVDCSVNNDGSDITLWHTQGPTQGNSPHMSVKLRISDADILRDRSLFRVYL